LLTYSPFFRLPLHSIARVANRTLESNGLHISGNNINLNFNESFKNIARYFFYFDKTDFIYTGNADQNSLIMSFRKSELVSFTACDLDFPQKFADYAFRGDRSNDDADAIIKANQNYQAERGRDPLQRFSY